MAWKEAHMYLNVEMWEEHHFVWKSKHVDVFDPATKKPSAVSHWSFEGGPRLLDPESIKSKSTPK
jgi:hypothetical protein